MIAAGRLNSPAIEPYLSMLLAIAGISCPPLNPTTDKEPLMRILTLTILLSASVSAADLAAGWTHSAAVREGQVWTWGDNTYGQLGQPDAGRSLRPRPVAGLRNIVAVAASWHTLALTADGHVYAWGRNTYGQLGNGRSGLDAQEMSPARVAEIADIVAVAAGWDHSLARSRAGTVYAWGSRCHGQLGDGVRETGRPASKPVRIADLTNVTAIAAGAHHSLALREDGTVYAWGSNWNGQLGNGKRKDGTHSAVPRAVIGAGKEGTLTGVVGIAAGELHSVAVTRDGQVYAWGYNGTGQVPGGTRGGFWGSRGRRGVSRPTAALAVGRKDRFAEGIAVAAGYESTHVLTGKGRVLAAGWSMYGELGSGSYGGGNRDRLQTVVTGRRVLWQSPPPGRWRPSLVYRYTDRTHAAKGIADLEVVDELKGSELVVASVPTAGVRTARSERRANYVEAQASLVYPARAAAGEPLSCVFARLMFGSHDGDDDFATDVRLRWTKAESGEVVDLPLGPNKRHGAGLLPPLDGIATVASGVHHVLVRDRAGAIWAWGHNGYGQIGDGTVVDCTVARKLPPFDESARSLQPKHRPTPSATAKPPDGKIVNVREHGAVGDGITLDQPALQRIIDKCSATGGGIVWFPPGAYRTGTLELRDGVRLHLSAGATILASTNREHYPGRAVVQAANVQDIGLTGQGTIDGQGHFVGARDWRHNCIHYDSCISGLPGHPVEDVVIEGLRVRVPGGATTVPVAAELPERPDAYPHAGNFGILPAYGLFVRHARDIALRNVVFDAVRPDARPPVAELDTQGFSIESATAR